MTIKRVVVNNGDIDVPSNVGPRPVFQLEQASSGGAISTCLAQISGGEIIVLEDDIHPNMRFRIRRHTRTDRPADGSMDVTLETVCGLRFYARRIGMQTLRDWFAALPGYPVHFKSLVE